MIDGPEFSKMLLRRAWRWAAVVLALALIVWAVAAYAGQVALVVTVCDGAACEERTVPLFDPAASALGCMLQAQAIVADPSAFDLRGDQRVARWECRS